MSSILADIKKETLCIDPNEIRKKISANTKGVMVVHLAGLIPPEMKEIQEICKENNLFLIEDAAHAPGASIDNKKAGNLGDVGCFSFFPTKPMTTGEGGIITTNDVKLAEFSKIVDKRDSVSLVAMIRDLRPALSHGTIIPPGCVERNFKWSSYDISFFSI